MKKRTFKYCKLCNRHWIEFNGDISGRSSECRKWSITVERDIPIIEFAPHTKNPGNNLWQILEQVKGDSRVVYQVGALHGDPVHGYKLALYGSRLEHLIPDYRLAALDQLGIEVSE